MRLSAQTTSLKEYRRFRAWELRQEGWTQQRIADALGVTQGAVSQWLKRAREGGGPEALRRRKAPGATPCLTLTQRAGIAQLLERHAAARVRLERLPGYAADLNPDEGIWDYLRRVELKNVCCRDLPHLHGELTKAIKRLRHRSRIIRGCINQTGLISW